MKLNRVLDLFFIVVIGMVVGFIFGRSSLSSRTMTPLPTPTPTPSRFHFECEASVDNPCRPHGRIIAYGATCAEAQTLLENDLQTLACK